MSKNMDKVKSQGKRGFFRAIYGRTIVVILLLVLQALFILGTFIWLRDYVFYVYGGATVLGLLVLVHIVNSRGNPSFKISWIIVVLVLPVFGVLLYLFLDRQWAPKIMEKKLLALGEKTREYAPGDRNVQKRLFDQDPQVAHMAQYIEAYGGYRAYEDTRAKYFPIGEEKFREMLVQLKKAEKFIFMEYFIVEEGYMWNTILDILVEKVEQGVEVRFMYDGMCCLVLMPYSYPKTMEALGIRCKMFSPIRPVLSTHLNNRDHRKILVIDGKVAFTGGINLADEYINRKVRFGHWKDTAIMIEGQAVQGFTLMFLEMWNITEWEPEDYERYLTPPDIYRGGSREGFVIPYGSDPLSEHHMGNRVYLDILNTAKEYVHIMTPYLILDYEMTQALKYAAYRGVEVKLILPHIPDKKYAFLLARDHYNELLSAGVKIYEYTPGFVHAKVFSSDGEKAVVGSINMDFRSLYLHFECGAYLFRNPEIAVIEQDFQDTLVLCREVEKEDYKKQSLLARAAAKILRFVAPLM